MINVSFINLLGQVSMNLLAFQFLKGMTKSIKKRM